MSAVEGAPVETNPAPRRRGFRIERISYTRYGPFAGVELAPPPTADLTIVYGPNEAGKSTALAGLVDWLYGMSEARADRDRAAFRFQPGDVLIEGALIGADGAPIQAARRRGRKNDLLDAAGAPIEPDRWSTALGGVGRDAFIQLFGLDKDRLREHAVALLEGGGALGESLLAGAAGLPGLAGAATALSAEADALFGARRTLKKPVFAAIDAFDQAASAERDALLTAPRLAEADRAMADAETRRIEAEAALVAARAAGERDRTLARTRADVFDLASAEAALAALDPATRGAPADAGDALRAGIAAVDAARAAAEAAETRRARAEDRLADLPARDPALDHGETISAAAAADARLSAPPPPNEKLAARIARIAAALDRPAERLASDAPTPEALARAEATLRGGRDLEAVARSAIDEAAAARSRTGTDAPSRAEIAAARTARDAAWTEIKGAIAAGRAPTTPSERFEALIATADRLADLRAAAAADGVAVARDRADAAAAALASWRADDGRVLAADLAFEGSAATLDDLGQFETALAAWRAAPDALAAAERAAAERDAFDRAAVELHEICARLADALDEADDPPPDRRRIAVWTRRLDAARAVEARRADAAAALARDLAERDAAVGAVDDATRRLRSAAERAGVADPDDWASNLAQAEAIAVRDAASKTAAALSRRVEKAAAEIGLDLGALRAAVEAEDWDALSLRRADADAEERRLARATAEAGEALAEAKAARARLLDSDALDAARSARRGAEADLGRRGRDWLRARMAARLLRQAADAHARAAGDGLLGDASRAFEALTLGSYSRIDARLDHEGRPRLAFERPDGSTTPIEGMSEGARDQLSLALRLAAIRRWAATQPPAPFVGDDLLASFDDRRRDAALDALAELGAATQTLLFTHHSHVVDAAENRLGDRVAVLTLG